jgi:hypothetical protein
MRKRVIIAVVGLLVVVFALTFWLLRPKPPFYAGKPLSYWAKEFRSGGTRRERAENAFRGMGSNAVPFLTIAVNAEESSIHRRVVQLVWKVPPFRRFVSTGDPPELLRARAGAVLAFIDAPAGRDTVAALRKTLDDPFYGARCNAVVALKIARNTSAARDAVAALIYATKDQNNVVRGNAYSILRYFAPGASEAIPVLERGLQDPEVSVRRSAANGLAAFAPVRQHADQEDNAPGR